MEAPEDRTVTPEQDEIRSIWRDRFEKQATARLSTLKDCAAELYGQAMLIGQGKDLIYRLSIPGVWAKTAVTVKDAGLAITEPSTHAKITLALAAQAGPSAMDKSPLDGTASEVSPTITPMPEVKWSAPAKPEYKPELTEEQKGMISIIEQAQDQISAVLKHAEESISAIIGSDVVTPVLVLNGWGRSTRGNIDLSLEICVLGVPQD